jgi:arylsulfatase
VGEPDIVNKVMRGHTMGGRSFTVHRDGYNLVPYFKGEAQESPRKEFLYWSDDGDLAAIRVNEWKVSFLEQNGEVSAKTPVGVWQSRFTHLRLPKLYNLRADPFERGPEGIYYPDWLARHTFVQVPIQAYVAQWLQSFKESPIRQGPASFNLDEVMRRLQEASGASR